MASISPATRSHEDADVARRMVVRRVRGRVLGGLGDFFPASCCIIRRSLVLDNVSAASE